jgi:hypothetical protein
MSSGPGPISSKASSKRQVRPSPILYRLLIDADLPLVDTPVRVKLFNDIASFVQEQTGDSASSEPALKRRRVDVAPSQQQNGTATNGIGPASPEQVAAESTLLEVKDISVSVPLRKKFDICFTAKHLYARAPGTSGPVTGVIYAWKDIGTC